MGCPGWGLRGAKMFGEGPSLVPGWEDECRWSLVVAHTGCGGGWVFLWGPEADGPGDLGVRAVRMSMLKVRGKIQQVDAKRHRHFLSGAAVMAAGFAFRVSTCAGNSLGCFSETGRNLEPYSSKAVPWSYNL